MNDILPSYFKDCATLIEGALEKSLPHDSHISARLHEAMRYSLLAPGKRIRPILCLAASEACGGGRNEVLPVACAIEMIHAFSLIHDDLPAMDDDSLRRGRPTNHKVYGEALAILAGDALVSQAFVILGRLRDHHRDSSRVLEIIQDIAEATGSLGMVGGQALDVEAAGTKPSLESLKQLYRLKTGRLLTVAITSGAKMVTKNREQVAQLEAYGDSIGMAFQIADDILDVEGGDGLGKDLGSDAANNKSTFPVVVGATRAKEHAHQLCEDAIRLLNEFGPEADMLRAIARYIVERKK